MKWRLLILVVIMSISFCTLPVSAQVSDERGLLITPPRQYLDAEAGKTTKSSITIANLTEETTNVALSFEQFSVADYTYDYHFEAPKEDWVRFETTNVSLKKTESRTIAYDIIAPPDANPGGHYFTLFATMSRGDGKLVRAATVLYITIKGELTKTATMQNDSFPLAAIGSEITYAFDVVSKGNTHFPIYVYGELHGISAKPRASEVAHVLLSDTIRSVDGRISAPLLPGIYQAIYGFKNEDGQDTVRMRFVLYAPPWSWALVAGVVWFAYAVIARRRRLKR